MNIFTKAFMAWLPLAVAITGLSGLVYVTVQQNYRQSLNDPQIQMAEDTAAKIAAGMQIDVAVPAGKVDIANSLSPYIIVFNNAGVPLLSQAMLDGKTPVPPQGVFDTTGWNRPKKAELPSPLIPSNEDRLTWQPEAGVRQAIVLVHYDSPNGIGYVLVGRNMREVENRELNLIYMTALAWAVILTATFIVQMFAVYLRSKE